MSLVVIETESKVVESEQAEVPKEHKSLKELLRNTKFLLGSLVAILVLIIYCSVAYNYREAFFMRTTINGIDCAGMTAKDAEAALKEKGTGGRSLFAGKRIGICGLTCAALIVDKEARALERPEHHTGQHGDKKTYKNFLQDDSPCPCSGSKGKAFPRGHLGQRHGVQDKIAGQHHGKAQLPRDERRPHEGRGLEEHEKARRSKNEGQQMLGGGIT